MEIFSYMEGRELNIDELFIIPDIARSDTHSAFRDMGHLMYKKINLWWDIIIIEQYLKEDIIPRKFRWDIPINDILTEDEDIKEWYEFFHGKEKEALIFIKKRKQRKLSRIEGIIKDLKANLEPNKDFRTLAERLSKNMIQKDKENKEK